jgi:transcriptional regulator with XRE-family HTH domain
MPSSLLSPSVIEALELLGVAIRTGRTRSGWTVEELAERVGVSHTTIRKAERGDPGTAIGTVFEAAVLVGVPLFDPDPTTRARYNAAKRGELALLPEAARRPRQRFSDDF